jgi:hypothetical protein
VSSGSSFALAGVALATVDFAGVALVAVGLAADGFFGFGFEDEALGSSSSSLDLNVRGVRSTMADRSEGRLTR